MRDLIKNEYYKLSYLTRSGRISLERKKELKKEFNSLIYNISDINKRSRRRKTIRDNIERKKLDWYATFTLKKELHEVKQTTIKKNITQLLRRYNIQYVLIPEQTKQDVIHFHGFIDIRDLKNIQPKIINNTLIKDKYKNQVYEFIPLEKNYGFTQLINITNKNDLEKTKMINYICKYLEKSDSKIMSSRLTSDPVDLAIHLFGKSVVKVK